MPRLTLKRASPVRRRLLRLYEALSRRYGPQGWWPEARRLRAFVDHLAARHGGHLGRMLRQPVDRLRAELLDVPGIGPQTADAILLYAAGRPVFVVDADTRRVLARHGIVPPTADYAALRTLFMTNLPHDPALFNEYHALIVRVARAHCRTRPDCAGCPLRSDLGGRPPRG